MNATATPARVRARRPLATLGKVTVGQLVALPFVIAYSVLQAGLASLTAQDYLQVGIFTVLSLVVAGVVATGWRWAPLLGAVFGALLFLAALVPTVLSLAHPPGAAAYLAVILIDAFTLGTIVTGIAAMVQNYRGGEQRPTPRWLVPGASALVALSVGMVLAIALAQTGRSGGTAADVSAQALASLPAVTADHIKFTSATLEAHSGQTVTLQLVNHDSTPHTFTIDALHVNVQMPPGQTVLALFVPAKAGTYTFYCSLHPSMTGTITVAP